MGRTIDLSTCCRTCLRSTCGLIPLDAEDKDSLKFSSKLTACITEIVCCFSDFGALFILCELYRFGWKTKCQVLYVNIVWSS